MKKLLSNKKLLAAIAIAIIIAIILPIAVFATAFDQRPVGVVGHLKFQGSTTVGPIVVNSIPTYTAHRSGTAIFAAGDVYQNASGDGRAAMANNPILTDIGMSSGLPDSTQPDGGWANAKLTPYAVARDGVVFIVNTSVTGISNMTKDQIADIYNGRLTNWNQIYDAVTGTEGPTLTIVPRARKIGSGTRAAFGDSIKTTDHNITYLSPDQDPVNNTGEPAGTKAENWVIFDSGQGRLDEQDQMQSAINSPTANGQCGYVGLGFETGANIKAINVTTYYSTGTVSVTTGSAVVTGNNTAWDSSMVGKKFMAYYTASPWDSSYYNIASVDSATQITLSSTFAGAPGNGKYVIARVAWTANGINIYSGSYPFARFLWLCLNNDTANPTNMSSAQANYTSDVMEYINWFKATDGAGQDAVVATGFLKLIPDQDVRIDNVINGQDLVVVGGNIGASNPGHPHWIRSDVKADGVVNGQDLVQVAGWVGTSIIPVP